MTTKASTGFGTLLKRGNADGPPETFTTVSEMLDLGGPGITADTIDASNMGSVNSMEEVIIGMIKSGTVDCDLQYVRGDVVHQGLITDCKTKTKRNFQVVLPDDVADPISFAAYVTKAQPKYPVTGKRTLSISLKITGDITGL
jgi:predicted secreted protein